jgi:hypothetical protein
MTEGAAFARRYQPNEAAIATINDLQREIEAFVEGSAGRVSLSLMTPAGDVVLGVNHDVPMPLASVAKLDLLFAYLSNLEREGRAWREDEADLLDALITYSDNGSADYLWQVVGAEEAMQRYFEQAGLGMASAGPDGLWGDTLDSATDTALLLARLQEGSLLGPESTTYAFDLLRAVFDGQRWGVSAGLDLGETHADAVFLKNGWYPADEGWRVNSAGIVRPGRGPAYVLVVLTDAQPSMEYGIETIETVARLANQFMRSGLMPLATRR